jgi:uncharacterized repeat protein (TIGR02543 family)
MWGATFVEKWQSGKLESTRSVVANITLGTNAAINSSRIEITSGNTGHFTIATITGYTITSVKFFMNSDDSKIATNSFTGTNGTVTKTDTKEWTYTPNSTPTSVDFEVQASGGKVQISRVWITFTDGVSDSYYESLVPTAVSSGTVTCTSTATTSYVSMTTSGSLNNQSISFGNNGTMTITATKNIKYILFSWHKNKPSADSKWEPQDSNGSMSVSANKWTPSNTTTKSVTFKRKESNNTEVSNIHIVYYGDPSNYTVTIDPNGGTYESTPDGWTLSAGVYTKSVTGGSFTPPTGLTKGTDELTWKDNHDNPITFPITLAKDTTFVAQWTPISEEPTISSHPSTSAAQYIKDATATALSVTASGSGNVTYQWYSNTTANNADGTIIDGATNASYTPSTAETGKLYYYCEVTNTETSKSPTTIKSDVSGLVRVVAAPTHLVENVMATSGTWDSYIVSTNAHISNLKTITASDDKTLIKSGKESASSPRTPGITSNSSSTLVESDYIYIQFTIEDGYELELSSISVPVFSISNEGKYVARISDNAGTPHVIQTDELAVAASADGTLFSGYDFSSSPTLTGTVTLKLFAYGWDKGYRMKSPVYIDGEVKAVGACSTPTIAWDGDQPENAFVSEGSKTFTVTSNYAAGVVFELSSNTCGATVAVKPETSNLQWIVSFTQAGSVTITPKVAGDGTTYCAGPVSAAAKTLTVTQAYDVTFNMNGHGAAISKQVVADGGKATAPYVADVDSWVFGGWYTDAECTAGNEFDFANTTITADRPLYAKWTADACASERKSLSKVVLTSNSAGTVTGHNGEEYAGAAVIAGLSDAKTAEIDASHEGEETGYKMNNGGSGIVFATLKKGSFQAGDKVVIGITKKQDSYKINSVSQNVLRVYYGTNASDATLLTTIENVSTEGNYTYRLTEADVTAIGEKKGIGVFRESSNGQNPYVYSVEITGCRSFAISHDVTFDMKGHGTQVTKQTIEVGAKVTEPTEPEAAGYIFGGWYKETTLENTWNFASDVMPDNDITLYAKWTEDPCTDRQSLSKVVLTSTTAGTVTGYNTNEYAGEAVIGGLSSTATADVDASHDGNETGYKLNNGGSAIVFATLKKGTFQEGDKVIVTITKANDAYKVEEVAQPVLDIYYGDSKDDATLLTTINGVTAAGSYIYRLTSADVTAIGDKKGIGVFRPSSGRTQNPYVYSVEITGCRSWATTHTVTYNKMGKGADVAPAVVAVGDLVPKPSVVEPDGWALAGWYKEEGLEHEWNFASDVMPDNNLTLYAKWEDETGAIKLFTDLGLNTTNFISAAKATDSVEINTVKYPYLVAFGSNRTSLAEAKQADLVMYSATTDATKIKFDLYNTNGSAKTAYVWLVEEGDDEATQLDAIEVAGTTRVKTAYYEFNGTKNRTVYLTSGAKADIKVLQAKVIESGSAIHQFGQAGYVVDFNKGRIAGAADGTVSFEGAAITLKSDYKVLNSTSLSPKTYIQFNNAVANTVVKIKKASTNKYYVTNDLDNKGTEYSSDQEITLTTTGTWYIGSVNSGSVAALSKIEFIAPKCDEPTITPMVNSDLCEGDVFAPLTVSADVSDEGTLHYAWYKHPTTGDDEAVGTDAASFTPEADGQYYVIVTNKKDGYSDNSATSNTITVEHFASAVITTAPLNKRAEAGQNATLTVAATGKNVSYAWFTCDENGDNEVAIDGASGTDKTSLLVPVTTSFEQWYKVKVTSDCGNTEAIAKVSEFVPATPANVTTSILWDWTSSAWPASGEVQFSDKITDGTDFSKDYELLANADAIVPNNDGFHSDMLYGKGQYVWRSGNKFFQGTAIKFNTTVAGMVRVYYRSTGNNKHVKVEVKNGANTTLAGTYETGDFRWSDYVEVEAGAVEILCTATDANKAMTRIQKIEFLAREDRRADTWVKPGELGTVCLENDAMVMGANIYALAGLDENGYLAFNQISNGELVAGKPYLFEATRSGDVSFYKTLNAGHADDADVTNGMHGTFSNKTFSPNTAESEGIYYFSGTHIWKVDDFSVSITVPAYRCYVDYDAVQAAGPAQAPAAGCRRVTLGVNGKNNATDVENLNASEAPVKLIIDGKMYILRGEKLFDATGRLVK